MKDKRTGFLTTAAFIISTILASNNAIAVTFSNAELPPFFGAGLRFTLAASALLLIVLSARLKLPKGKALAGVLILGSLQYGFSYALLYWSLLEIPAGLFQVILALVPLMTFLFAILHGQEEFEWRILAGGLLSLAGIAIIFRNQINANVPPIPMLAVIGAAACFAEASVLFKTFPKTHPVTTNSVAMATGAVILFIASALFGEPVMLPGHLNTWLALGYLVLFGSATAFVLGVYVLSQWKASIAAYQAVIMPIATVIFAYFLLQEPITRVLLLGGFFILLGVFIGALAPAGLLKIFSSASKRKNIS